MRIAKEFAKKQFRKRPGNLGGTGKRRRERVRNGTTEEMDISQHMDGIKAVNNVQVSDAYFQWSRGPLGVTNVVLGPLGGNPHDFNCTRAGRGP